VGGFHIACIGSAIHATAWYSYSCYSTERVIITEGIFDKGTTA
jgi:hypothetical protein